MQPVLTTGTLLQLWCKTSFRHWRGHGFQFVILVSILALGVASFLSIRMANRAAIQGFRGFTESVTGSPDFTLSAPGDRFPISWLPEIREALVDFPVEIAPVLEIRARVIDSEIYRPESVEQAPPGESITILGVDVIGLRNIHNSTAGNRFLNTADLNQEFNIRNLLLELDAIFISPVLADTTNKSTGDSLKLLVNDYSMAVDIRGILPTNRLGVEVPPDLALMDLPAAMTLARENKAVSRVELFLETDKKSPDLDKAIEQKLLEASSGRWQVITPATQDQTNASMTAAFRLNLTILSLISLLVGIYLISQSLDSAVIQRRREIGILRAMGLLPAEIRKHWLIDLCAFGLLGSLFGILLGWLASQLAVVAIARTINALYLSSTAQSAQLNSADCLWGLVIGFFGSLAAGLFPLKEANEVQPAVILASGRQPLGYSSFRYQTFGWVLMGAGFLLSRLPPVEIAPGTRIPVFGYVTAFTWLIGGSLILAGLIGPAGKFLKRWLAFSVATHVGFGKLRLPGNRHRFAVSGLFVAIGMAASMSILIGSFEKTVLGWINFRFQADLYVTSRAFTGGASPALVSEATAKELQAETFVEDISTLRFLNVTYRNRPIFLQGFRSELTGTREKFLWIHELLPISQKPEKADAWAIANEAFQYRFQHKAGDLVQLTTPVGTRTLWIRGVKADYGSDRGTLLMDRSYLESWYGTTDYSSFSLYLKPGFEADKIAQDLTEKFPQLAIREQGSLLRNAIRVFKETFAVTYALRILGLFVALAGLALALLNILKEDSYSLATLNALGTSRKEKAHITGCEGIGMTLIGTLGGIILSFLLGWLLVFVVNRQSFGWTLQYSIPWKDLIILSI
ncbi:MAG: ABC transporter permease, partial [Verrucomicrobiae bacterium]|nr:ABC transporter permease [Verrucomicrobiae bacterium]